MQVCKTWVQPILVKIINTISQPPLTRSEKTKTQLTLTRRLRWIMFSNLQAHISNPRWCRPIVAKVVVVAICEAIMVLKNLPKNRYKLLLPNNHHPQVGVLLMGKPFYMSSLQMSFSKMSAILLTKILTRGWWLERSRLLEKAWRISRLKKWVKIWRNRRGASKI